jgi:hypothetical protein
MSATFFYQFDSELHRQWRADRALRRRVKLTDTWRGCLGLGFLLDRPDDTVAHDELALVKNDQVRWAVLRDVPVGHFPGCRMLDRRDVGWASFATATLRHGMPCLDFRAEARGSVDFSIFPMPEHSHRFGPRAWDVELRVPGSDTLDSGRYPREFVLLNRLSALMTQYAFCGIEPNGRPLRRPWFAVRPEEREPFVPESPAARFPVPYLAFRADQAEQLYWAATRSRAEEWAWTCAACRTATTGSTFGRCDRSDAKVLESGDFVATCPACGTRRKWFLDDARACHVRRDFPAAFRDAFCRAVAKGVVLRTAGHETYCGSPRDRGDSAMTDPECHGPNLVRHTFRDDNTTRIRMVFLPTRAAVLVNEGTALEPGQPWARLTAPASAAWRDLAPDAQWRRLAEPLGSNAMAPLAQRLWFDAQLLRLPEAAGQVLLRADLVSNAVYDVAPIGLWWDTRPTLTRDCYRWEDATAALPPIRLRRWSAFRLRLPHEVALIADIVDPRFSLDGENWQIAEDKHVCTSEPSAPVS